MISIMIWFKKLSAVVQIESSLEQQALTAEEKVWNSMVDLTPLIF